MNYQLTLKNTKLNTYLLISNLMTALNAAGLFSYYFSYELIKKIKLVFIAVLIINALYLFIKIAERVSKKNQPEHWYRIVFVISAIAWFLSGWWWVGILLLLLALLDFYAKRPLIVTVSEAGVTYPSLPVRKISWAELSNIILKDDLLTIDLKNNKLIQQMTESLNNINEAEFNSFCEKQLIISSGPAA